MPFDADRHPKVFISYSHDSAHHMDRVLEKCNRLVADGIDVILDQYVKGTPTEGWPRWMDLNIKNYDFVLMICTPLYCKRVMGEEEPGVGLGVKWEGNLIYQHIYNNDSANEKFIPCLFAEGKPENVPTPLQGATRYNLDNESDYEKLYRYLTDQAETVKPKLGKLRRLPARERRNDLLGPRIRKEKLYVNLLEVSSFAKEIYMAETPYRQQTLKALWAKLRESGGSYGPELLLKEKRVISFHNLREYPWNEICDLGTCEVFESSEWADSHEMDRQREFVWLLNQSLKEKTRRLGIRYRKDFDLFYFLPSKGLKPRRIPSGSLKQRRYVTVYKAYRSRKDPNRIMYHRHRAFEGVFKRYGGRWYLEITPTYYYTSDGENLYRFYEDYLKGMKRLDRNHNFLSQFMAIARFLREERLFGRYRFLKFGAPLSFDLAVGLDDGEWLACDVRGDDKAIANAKDELVFTYED